MTTNCASAASPHEKTFDVPHMAQRGSSPDQSRLLTRQEKRKFVKISGGLGAQPRRRSQARQLQYQHSQGSASTASASKWFDSVDKNVESGQRRFPHNSDEPPFYLSGNQDFHPNYVVSSKSEALFGAEHQDLDNDSENDDLRGVIDDLTVENKRLMMLLKSQRVRHSALSDAQDRIFELRVHGLSADKKRELEELLQNFAATVSAKPSSIPSSSAAYGSGQMNTSEASPHSGQRAVTKTLHTDSGYASNSHSGLRSPIESTDGKPSMPISKCSRNRHIKNYLHDIPDVLLPRGSTYMTERSKTAVIVRKLEQLFTGKNAAPGEHSQPMQQQEVSQSAARVDATTNRRLRKCEGLREAQMLPQNGTVNLDAMNQEQQPSPPSKTRKMRHETSSSSTSDTRGSIVSRSNPPDQRPTQPLDLDIHRAQIADENIEYLRHLGLSSPHIRCGGDTAEHPWLYLNLLINMAQLHTINVTPAFIRQAIRKRSTKFELSSDGHKVRWRGGAEGTAFSTEEEQATEVSNDDPVEPTEDVPGNSNRSKATSSCNNLDSEELSSATNTSAQCTTNTNQKTLANATPDMSASMPKTDTDSKLDNKPLFCERKKYTPQESYLGSASSSYTSEDSSGPARPSSKWHFGHRGSDGGVITFFNNPYFCSDGSADSALINWKLMRQVLPGATLGIEHEPLDEAPLRQHDACYFTRQFEAAPYAAQSNAPRFVFPQTRMTAAGKYETQLMELPVSGIGGVYPEDNFALDVKVGRQLHTEQPVSERVPFTRTHKRKRYSYRTLRAEMLSLQPSELPPPSYIFDTSSPSSSNADMVDESDSEASSSAEEKYPAPPAFFNHWSEGSSDEGDEQDSSSIDTLATARAAEPNRIAAAERHFIRTHPHVAGTVEGSLAATVGASGSSSTETEDDLRSDIRSDEDVAGSDMEMDQDDEE